MAERPVECSQCKKPTKVFYKEFMNGAMTCTEMCADCPLLQQKLQGSSDTDFPKREELGIYCGNCHTSLEAVKMGNPLGCSECYNVFVDLLVSELISLEKIPPRLQKNLANKKNQPLHLGKTLKATPSIAPSAQLTTLNEALNEALQKENYEQAAWLRDQIKALREKTEHA